MIVKSEVKKNKMHEIDYFSKKTPYFPILTVFFFRHCGAPAPSSGRRSFIFSLMFPRNHVVDKTSHGCFHWLFRRLWLRDTVLSVLFDRHLINKHDTSFASYNIIIITISNSTSNIVFLLKPLLGYCFDVA